MGVSTTSSDQSVSQPSWRLFLPGVGAWYLMFLLAGFLFLRPYILLWDGGACRHLEIGSQALTTFQIPTTNYVSALFPKVPWAPNSLLGDLIYGIFYYFWKLKGVVAIGSLSIVLGLTWAYQLGRARGLGAVSGPVLLILAMIAESMHWSARCHIFSYLTFLALYYLLFMAAGNKQHRLYAIALVMMIWANLHGSFFIGFFLIGAKLVADWLESSWSGSKTDDLKSDVLTLAASALAVCVNVRGPGIYSYISGYLAHPMILLKTDEFRSIDFGLGFQTWSFLIIYLFLMALWALASYRPRLWEVIVVNGLFVAGLYSMRMIPYAVLAAMIAAGPAWLAFKQSLLADEPVTSREPVTSVDEPVASGEQTPDTASGAEPGSVLKRVALKVMKLEARQEVVESKVKTANKVEGVVAAILLAAFLFLPIVKIDDFDKERLPVKAVDYIVANNMNGLGFVYDNWGGYLHWRLNKPIFIDDWTNFYPDSFLADYLRAMTGQPGWDTVLDRYELQYVLVPHNTALTGLLSCSPRWRRVFFDEPSELFVKQPETTP